MKRLTRTVSLLSVVGLLSGGALLAQTSTPSTGSGSTGGTTGAGSASSSTQPYNPSSTGATRSMNNEPVVGGSGSMSGTGTGDATGAGALSGSANAATGSASALGASGYLNASDPIYSTIQSRDYASRSQLVDDIESRIDAEKDTLKSIKRDSKNLEGQAKSDFKTAWNELEQREKDLKRSLRDLRTMSQDKWDTTRAELATRYQAYMTAIARTQAQVSPGAAAGMNSGMSSSSSTDSSSATNRMETNGRSDTHGSSATDTPATSR